VNFHSRDKQAQLITGKIIDSEIGEKSSPTRLDFPYAGHVACYTCIRAFHVHRHTPRRAARRTRTFVERPVIRSSPGYNVPKASIACTRDEEDARSLLWPKLVPGRCVCACVPACMRACTPHRGAARVTRTRLRNTRFAAICVYTREESYMPVVYG